MKTLFVIGLIAFSSSAFSAVYKSFDSKQSCVLYRVDNIGQPRDKEETTYAKNVYGISFENLEVDFDNREAKVQVMLNVTLGLNRALQDTKASISEDNANFTTLINHLNRKIKLFENICFSLLENKVVYANEFKAE